MGTVYATTTDLQNLGLPPKALQNVTPAQQSAALAAASAVADGYLNTRFVLPIIAWEQDLTQAVCKLAGWNLLCVRGFDPENPGDQTVRTNYTDALRWLQDIAGERVQPVVVDSSVGGDTSAAPQVYSEPLRGW